MSELTSEQRQLARAKALQIFRFLKGYAERRESLKRTLAEHEWTLRLRDLPQHPCVDIGQVLLNGDAEESPIGTSSGALLTIRRPKLTKAPQPPEVLDGWLEKDWQDPTSEIRVRDKRYVRRGDETVS